jgi:hypothetical protein
MNCKVITTCFTGAHDIRTHYDRQLSYPDHYQNVSSPAEALDQLKQIIELEKQFEPGVPVDLIIVNNNTGFTPGNSYLDSINENKTRWGTIRVLHRENIGWSFGGFNHAYQVYKNDYDYWLFTEDDIIVGGNMYYRKLIDKFKEDKMNGFVSLVKVCDHSYGKHCGGGVGLTHKDVLYRVDKIHGCLPYYHYPLNDNSSVISNRQNIITAGEVPFTHFIHLMNYNLVDYGNATEWDLEKNLCIPYYHYVYKL